MASREPRKTRAQTRLEEAAAKNAEDLDRSINAQSNGDLTVDTAEDNSSPAETMDRAVPDTGDETETTQHGDDINEKEEATKGQKEPSTESYKAADENKDTSMTETTDEQEEAQQKNDENNTEEAASNKDDDRTGDMVVDDDMTTPAKSTDIPNLRPGGNAGSYKNAIEHGTPLTHNGQPNSFLLIKKYADTYKDLLQDDIPDDVTVQQEGASSKIQHARFKLMVAIPPEKDEDCLQTAIEMVNAMVKSLLNKKPNIRIGHWNWNDTVKKDDLLTEVPTDVDTAEKVMQGFSRFVRAGQYCYYRLNLYFLEDTDLASVTYYTEQFRIQRKQFFEVAASDALEPLEMGTFSGSEAAMTTSNDVTSCFKRMFGLKHLGLTWEYAKGSKGYTQEKFKMHAEIDMCDRHKIDEIRTYFNRKTTSLLSNFLGTPMLLAPPVTPKMDLNDKHRALSQLNTHAKLMKNLEHCTVYGVHPCNYVDLGNRVTLLQKLMELESRTAKKLIRDKKTFYGRLFYAIIPNKSDASATFYYSRANSKEGRSCAQALPALIRDELRLDPHFFCNSEFIADVQAGHWDPTKRLFQTQEEKDECDQLAEFEDQAEAEVVEYVSPEHQKALALDGESIGDATKMTMGDEEAPKLSEAQSPLPLNITTTTSGDDNTTLTDRTSDSKAERFAGEVAKELTNAHNLQLLQKEKELQALKDQLAQKDDVSQCSGRTSNSKAKAYGDEVAKQLVDTYNVKLSDRDKEIELLRKQGELRDQAMAAMEERFQTMLTQLHTQSTQKEHLSDEGSKNSGRSTDGSKTSGQSSGEKGELEEMVVVDPPNHSTGKQNQNQNAAEISHTPQRDKSYTGRRSASEISKTPDRNKSVASRIIAQAKRKDFRTSDRLEIVAIEPPADSGPAGGGND